MKQIGTKPFEERRSANLLAVTQRALRPLIKLLVHRGIAFPALVEAMKLVFFRVAREEFPLQGKKDTDSRLSVLTGIHRRDIKRLREQVDARAGAAGEARTVDHPAATEISLSARVIALWTGTSEYLDAGNNPKPLPRLARHGIGQSFESLVRQVNRDVRPRALLDEWLRRGAVTLDAEDQVCLNLNVFMARKDLDEKAFYFAQNIHDHLATIAHNMTGDQPPYLERCVYYGGLTPESVSELAELAREQGMKTLQDINRRALQLKQQDAEKADAVQRINFGMYFYNTENAPPLAGGDAKEPKAP